MSRLILASFCAFAYTVAANAADPKCPVSGKPCSKEHAVSYKGAKVYFCCPNCPKAFEANKEKFAAKANLQLVQTGQAVQVACPLAGRKINPATAIEIEGVKVAFCCNNCKGKASQADDQVSLVFANADKGFTTQTKCPVSGKEIDPANTAEYKGKTVYFCCPNCPKAFSGNPEKFADKLPQLKDE